MLPIVSVPFFFFDSAFIIAGVNVKNKGDYSCSRKLSLSYLQCLFLLVHFQFLLLPLARVLRIWFVLGVAQGFRFLVPLSLGVKTKLFICVLNMGQVVITREFVKPSKEQI